jgi:chorismate synthase
MIGSSEIKTHKLQETIEVRECLTFDEFDACMKLQRAAFSLPEVEVSPRRHFIVTRATGGFTLGAFRGQALVGFVHQLVAVRSSKAGEREIIGYSHMMAVSPDEQNTGIGARLKWAQRERSLSEGIQFIRWTWDPMQARNAHFNLNRLGVIVRSYAQNFYGTDYNVHAHELSETKIGIDSDRLVAEWDLRSPRVEALARRHQALIAGESGDWVDDSLIAMKSAITATVRIPANWSALLREDRAAARAEHDRVRAEFETALASGSVCAAFERDSMQYAFF